MPLLMPAGSAPCDIYKNAGTPCVAAHSVVRALYSGYAGALYTVTRSRDNATLQIGVLETGGYANSTAQDAFCTGGDIGKQPACTISRIFDQSANANHLDVFPGGWNGHAGHDKGANASRDGHTVGGHRVYSAYIENGVGYRNDNTTGVAVGEQAESMYMVVSGRHFNGKCW